MYIPGNDSETETCDRTLIHIFCHYAFFVLLLLFFPISKLLFLSNLTRLKWKRSYKLDEDEN
jgi:uncharacterized membrane protein